MDVKDSNLIFTKTDNIWTKKGDKLGCAAIENDGDLYNELMILGRSNGTDQDRKVGIWNDLTVKGAMIVEKNANLLADLTVNGKMTVGKKVNLLEDLNVAGKMTIANNVYIDSPFKCAVLDVKGSITAIVFKGDGSQLTGIKPGQWEIIPGGIFYGSKVGIGTKTPSAELEVNGSIKVSGDVILANADCAEDFDIVGAESIEPGTVMVIDNEGALRASEQAYDKRVAGVISGAGDLRPGIMLDRQKERDNRLPIALTGKVYCKVDAKYNSIDVGDLLTTSPTIGHAMKVNDYNRSIGTIIGKALRPLKSGLGLIPILVALQ